jgi:hypothetical protein
MDELSGCFYFVLHWRKMEQFEITRADLSISIRPLEIPADRKSIRFDRSRNKPFGFSHTVVRKSQLRRPRTNGRLMRLGLQLS